MPYLARRSPSQKRKHKGGTQMGVSRSFPPLGGPGSLRGTPDLCLRFLLLELGE